ncbi:hypothetical protein L227DRAFT_424045 [Lentinus tigrinus ALCF2SS1-6]|uniref:DUF6533 domain-containing protein n=2 Tax=Lentinus tigrinus TaxID=5365 RepID=A0A5C2RP89_9APHY|nr:hypothetical protein L227DRAFT_424045 [Lentinus tigrinus ALCF2SS1-6]
MSSDADSDAAEIVALFDSLYIQNLCLVTSSALFIYEVFITFDREVACFWTAKQTGASLLFFANKWISITCAIMTLVAFAPLPSDESCSKFQIATTAMLILQFVPGAIFSALRAFVLGKSKILGLLVLILSLAPVGANLAFYGYDLSGQNIPPFGCIQTLDMTEASNLR